MWNHVVLSLLLLLFLNSTPHLAMKPAIGTHHRETDTLMHEQVKEKLRKLSLHVVYEKNLLQGMSKVQHLLKQPYLTYLERQQLRLLLQMSSFQISSPNQYVTFQNEQQRTQLEDALARLEEQLNQQRSPAQQQQQNEQHPQQVMMQVLLVIQRAQNLERIDLLGLITAVLDLGPEVQNELNPNILSTVNEYRKNLRLRQQLQNPNSENAGKSPDTIHSTTLQDLKNVLKSENVPLLFEAAEQDP